MVCRVLHLTYSLFFSHVKYLCANQYGFRRESQTSDKVQGMLNNITKNSKKSIDNRVTFVAYIDHSKAFDKTNYFTKMLAIQRKL